MCHSPKASVRMSVTPAFPGGIMKYLPSMLLVLVCFFSTGASATSYYVATNGNDGYSGTIDSPWRHVKYALSKLHAGDTLYLRSGTYYETSTTVGLKGTPSAWITVQSYPGERAVIDGGVPDFASAPNSGWTLVDAFTGLYRSVNANFSGSDLTANATIGGWLLDSNTQLVHYGHSTGETPDSLESTNFTVNGFNPVYIGPGLQLRGDGHVYIRLDPNPYNRLDANGNATLPDIPTDTDPNYNRISVFLTGTLYTLDGAAYLMFQDIDFVDAITLFRLKNSANNIHFDQDFFRYGTYGIVSDLGAANNVEIGYSEFTNGVPPWMRWTDVKDIDVEDSPAYPEFQSVAIDGLPSSFDVHDNYLHKIFDGVHFKDGTANVSFVNNSIFLSHDDAFEISPLVSDVEIAHNMMRHVHNGFGIDRSSTCTGAGIIYMHHNVMDTSASQRQGREGSAKLSQYPLWAPYSPFASHGSGCDTYQLRFYNNTVVGRHPSNNNPLGPSNMTASPSLYVYNNLWYAIDNVSALSKHLESSGAHYDGDAFWQPAPNGQHLLYDFGVSSSSSFDSVASYVSTPGTTWLKHSIQTDPGLSLNAIDSDSIDPTTAWAIYQPTADQIFTVGLDTTGLGWPEGDGITYRGAVDFQPSGTTSTTSSTTSTTSSTTTSTTTTTLPPSTQLSAPTNVRARVFKNHINLAWTAPDQGVAAGYQVYRNGTLIGTTRNTTYSDKNIEPSTTYTYTVVAYDAAGDTSGPSQPVSVRTR
jgi:Fibronectin type III domain